MTLAKDLDALSEVASTADLLSVSGVRLGGDGFRVAYTDVLQAISRYATGGSDAKPGSRKAWDSVLGSLNVTYGNVAASKPKPTADETIGQIARLLSINNRDHNFFNYLLGFGATGQQLSTLLEDAQKAFGISETQATDPDFMSQYLAIIKAQKRAVSPDPSSGTIDPSITTITDSGESRLYLKLDLSEWLSIRNSCIRFVVVESAQTVDDYHPLGRTTVWLSADAQVQHVRSKTAKTFLRGQIAQRLRIEDIESNLPGFVNTIFDTDSEQAYSSSRGPC